MPKNVTLNGYMNLATGRLDPDAPAPGKTIIINGTGFGSGPNVVLFDQFIGGHLSPAFRRPDVGFWNNISVYTAETPRLYYDSGTNRSWYCARDPGALSSADPNKGTLFKYFGDQADHMQFRYSHRAWVPVGKIFPGSNISANLPEISSWKMTWFGKSNPNRSDLIGRDSPHRNVCIPTYTGSGQIQIAGNNNGPIYNDNGNLRSVYLPWSFTQPTMYSYYQSGAGTYNVFNQTCEIIAASSGSFYHLARDDFDPLHGSDAAFNTRDYDGFTMTGWFTNGPNGYVEITPLIADVYLATGPNSRAALYVSNSPLFNAAPSQLHYCNPIYWTNTEIRTTLADHADFGANTHFHIELANGVIIQNVPFIRV